MNSTETETNGKVCYVGAPKIFELELACRPVCDAFDSYGIYLVGSSLHTPNWRDIDLRMIMSDSKFEKLFPNAFGDGSWEFDTRWLLLTTSISERLSRLTDLPIDFQFQPQTYANKYHKKLRHAIGIRSKKPSRTTKTFITKKPIALTKTQKLHALAHKYYSHVTWNPKAGDYYTSARADLELYQVIEVTDTEVITVYCDPEKKADPAHWSIDEFLAPNTFGTSRVYVPDIFLEMT